jgi:HEAT repeat protein
VWAAGEGISPEAQPYVKQLDAKDAYVRQEAFLHLEALREPATAPVVRQYLTSKDLETRVFAVRAVAAIEGAKAVPTVLERLHKRERPAVRVAAVLALEPLQKQDPSVAPALIAALRDRSPQVRMAAVDVVSRIKQPEAKAAILTRWRRERHRDVRRVLELAMKRIGAL